MPPDAIDSFISRWENSGATERANDPMFLSELCDILEVPRPNPSKPPSPALIQILPLPIKNPKSTILNRQSTTLPLSSGPTACRIK